MAELERIVAIMVDLAEAELERTEAVEAPVVMVVASSPAVVAVMERWWAWRRKGEAVALSLDAGAAVGLGLALRRKGEAVALSLDAIEAVVHTPDDLQTQHPLCPTMRRNDDGQFDKAEWTNSENTAAFCTLSVEEITASNWSNGFMTARGGIASSDEFWKKHTKGHAAWRKLKQGPPENLSELEIMFVHTAIDGSMSCVLGEHMDEEGNVGEQGDEEEGDGSPMSVTNNKRSTHSTATVTSPKKRIKSPMVRIMKGIWEDMKETNAAAQKALQDKALHTEKALQAKATQVEAIKDSITKCMSLAIESGASEGSAEHFMAGRLFAKEEHQQMISSSDDSLDTASSDGSVDSLCVSDAEDDTIAIARQTLKMHAGVACIFVAGWPGSVYDMRVFNDALNKYGDKFSHPPQGIESISDTVVEPIVGIKGKLMSTLSYVDPVKSSQGLKNDSVTMSEVDDECLESQASRIS
ncbi:hypothetical protein PR202_gb00623 [Eleusine coracana subsp. coracana]|uniref:Uncharacterized protein n=1 Tax=Eleusine coracana subsp. coracana TaxID=191504 RepID=A0AAV5DUS6_ELECO|nr:hypothetical protein PR202_gb00623 [Eleusine coracana subsp. coracana]